MFEQALEMRFDALPALFFLFNHFWVQNSELQGDYDKEKSNLHRD